MWLFTSSNTWSLSTTYCMRVHFVYGRFSSSLFYVGFVWNCFSLTSSDITQMHITRFLEFRMASLAKRVVEDSSQGKLYGSS